MPFTDHDKNIAEMLERELQHFQREKDTYSELEKSLQNARRQTGLRGAWAKRVTIPYLQRKINSERSLVENRRQRLYIAAENALFTLGRQAVRECGDVETRVALGDFSRHRFFFMLAELVQMTDAKIGAALGENRQIRPLDLYVGGKEMEGLRLGDATDAYRILMDADDFIYMLQHHLRDADPQVQKDFSAVGKAGSLDKALADVLNYHGLMHVYIGARSIDRAEEKLSDMRASIRRLNDVFIREIAEAQGEYPRLAPAMQAKFVKALEQLKERLPGGEKTLKNLRAARLALTEKPLQRPQRHAASKMRLK